MVQELGGEIENGAKIDLQQTPDAEAFSGRGRCRCGTSKALRRSWHIGVHPSFFWGSRTYTRFDQARHDKAIGLRSQSFQTVITSPRLNSHLLESDLNVMGVRLDEAKTYYTNATITTEELSKAKQAFGDDFPDDVSARSGFFTKLKDEVLSLISKYSAMQPDTASNTDGEN